MIQILPAVLAKTEEEYRGDIEKLQESTSFQEGWVHIDFMDNKFVPNGSISPEIVSKYPTNLKKEAHLMVESPLEWIDQLKEAGFSRVVFHFESKDAVDDVIARVKEAGMEVGVAIKKETSVESLESFMSKIDMVLVMGVEPGFQGQPFIEETYQRIKDLSEKRGDNPFKIAVDGAVRDSNAKELVDVGVEQLDIGSFLLKGEIEENVEKIWEAIQS